MKAIARVTGIVVVASAAIFALNLGTAMAAPPPPFEHELLPLQEIDSCILLGTCEEEPPLLNICATSPWLCEPLAPIDPCIVLGNCDVDDSSVDTQQEPTATPTDEPTPTATATATATATDEPTVEPTDEPTAQPTDVPPAATPTTANPGNLPTAGDNGSPVADIGNGVVLLAALSFGSMAMAWITILASRKRAQTDQ